MADTSRPNAGHAPTADVDPDYPLVEVPAAARLLFGALGFAQRHAVREPAA